MLSTALLVPAIPLDAQEDEQPPPGQAAPAVTLTPSNVRPDAALTAALDGGSVSLDASGSVDADGEVASYEWDLDGDGAFEITTGSEPRVQHDYPAGSTLTAAVRVTDDAGASDDAGAEVAVPPDPPLVPTGELAGPAPQPPASKRRKRQRNDASPEPTVRSAANGAVTIRDFSFAPATINVKPGDSVTWVNRGPTVHTATASDGSFDSGNLARGRSYSKTFRSAGTFSYLCTPHPFMTGKVVVGAGSGSGSGSGDAGASGSGAGGGSGESGSGDTAGSTAAGDGAGGSGDLARTGADLIPWSLFGFSLVAFGAALRFRLTD